MKRTSFCNTNTQSNLPMLLLGKDGSDWEAGYSTGHSICNGWQGWWDLTLLHKTSSCSLTQPSLVSVLSLGFCFSRLPFPCWPLYSLLLSAIQDFSNCLLAFRVWWKLVVCCAPITKPRVKYSGMEINNVFAQSIFNQKCVFLYFSLIRVAL